MITGKKNYQVEINKIYRPATNLSERKRSDKKNELVYGSGSANLLEEVARSPGRYRGGVVSNAWQIKSIPPSLF